MRDYCLDCTIKHLGQAYVLHSEVESGYPKHLIAVIGHLAEASEECIGASKELSDEIRQYRLLLLENLIPIMKEEKKVSIPYFDLFEKIAKIIGEKGCGNCQKAKDDFKAKLNIKKSESSMATLIDLIEGMLLYYGDGPICQAPGNIRCICAKCVREKLLKEKDKVIK